MADDKKLFTKVKDAVSGYFRRDPDPPKPEPKQPEQRVTISQAPKDVTQEWKDKARDDPMYRGYGHFKDKPSRDPGTGNTPDRTDQTAEGRAHIKRQKSHGRER